MARRRFAPVRVPRTLVVLALVASWAGGCTRGRYYVQADREVSTLLAEKSCDPRWAVPATYTVRQDERSRFYDAYDQVFPPMPPDDPTAHRYMHCVDGKKGWPRWHANGDRTTLDNPDWRARLHEVVTLTSSGAVQLDLTAAVRLAYLNSLDWQDQLETLYLSALDVSTERFRFDVQFYGGNTTDYANRGPLNPRGPATTWTTDTNLRAQKYFATAGTVVVGILNSVVWQFAGPDRYSNVSLVNFNPDLEGSKPSSSGGSTLMLGKDSFIDWANVSITRFSVWLKDPCVRATVPLPPRAVPIFWAVSRAYSAGSQLMMPKAPSTEPSGIKKWGRITGRFRRLIFSINKL